MLTDSKFRPKQTLGQNFLTDENVARKIVDAIAPRPDDLIIEIGPGFGALTKYLIEEPAKVVAVEIDRRVAESLQNRFGNCDNFDLVVDDFLKTDLSQLKDDNRRMRVVGNIPYHITSPVIFKVFDSGRGIADMTLMIQREVADRIIARPRTKAYGILSVVSRLYSNPTQMFHVSRNVFKPKPDVESTIVNWDLAKAPKFDIANELLLRNVIRATFNQRRKMLRKSLQQLPEFIQKKDQLNFKLERRPEELTVDEFVELSNQLAA